MLARVLVQAGIENRNQDRQTLGDLFFWRLVEIVFPEVDDQEAIFVPIWQQLRHLASFMDARPAPDHLLQFDA